KHDISRILLTGQGVTERSPLRWERAGPAVVLDLANQVQGRSKCCFAFLPFRRADFARVIGHVLGSLDLAQQFLGITTDTAGSDFHDLDAAFGIDNEGAALCEAISFNHDLKGTADRASGVAKHWVLDLADGVGAVVARLVGKMGVGGDRIDFHAALAKLFVVVSEVAELGWTNESEVCRIKEHYRPL